MALSCAGRPCDVWIGRAGKQPVPGPGVVLEKFPLHACGSVSSLNGDTQDRLAPYCASPPLSLRTWRWHKTARSSTAPSTLPRCSTACAPFADCRRRPQSRSLWRATTRRWRASHRSVYVTASRRRFLRRGLVSHFTLSVGQRCLGCRTDISGLTDEDQPMPRSRPCHVEVRGCE